MEFASTSILVYFTARGIVHGIGYQEIFIIINYHFKYFWKYEYFLQQLKSR